MSLPEPLGILLVLPVIIITFIVGIIVSINGRRSKKLVVTGIGIILSPWLIFAIFGFLFTDIDEWNPWIDSDSQVHGHWEGDGYSISLSADSKFEAQLKTESVKGTWKRDDWNLYLTSETGSKLYMRFVENSGQLILLTKPPKDGSFRPGPITHKN